MKQFHKQRMYQVFSKHEIMVNTAFCAMCKPMRQNILQVLSKEGSLNAGGITNRIDFNTNTFSYNMGVLREAGLVDATQVGHEVLYSLNPYTARELRMWLLDIFGEPPDLDQGQSINSPDAS